MQLPTSNTPNPATVQDLKKCSPDIPAQLDLFIRSLMRGLTPRFRSACKDTIDRKVTAMASDALYNVTHGTVKPSLPGFKLTMQILNRAGHSISYSKTKGLETEFACSVESYEHDTHDGICLDPSLATACVWDNNDANIETLHSKGTLHAAVCHSYQNVLQDDRQHSFFHK